MSKCQSVVTEYTEICALCARSRDGWHHLIFGNGLRELAEKDLIKIPICHRCHNMAPHLSEQIHENVVAEALSKMLGQMAWEKDYYRKKLPETDTDEAREAFRKRYGISYL